MTEDKERNPYEYRMSITDDKGRFIWNDLRSEVATMLAQGYEKTYIAEQVGISRITIYTWLKYPEFEEEVDRLSLMLGAASKAYRLRLINKAIRQFEEENGKLELNGSTLLDYLKEARMQAEGVRLGIISELATIIEEDASLTGDGPTRNTKLLEVEAKDPE